jgi:3-keto-disaccharide hydrolase
MPGGGSGCAGLPLDKARTVTQQNGGRTFCFDSRDKSAYCGPWKVNSSMRIHRFIKMAGVLTLSAMALMSCSTSSGRKRAIQLFNGKDLEGWNYVTADSQVPMDQVWSAQDGILTCRGTPVGAIYKGPHVTDFMLLVEYRWGPDQKPGNSGIFSRISEPLKPIPQAVEVQLMHGSAGDTLGLQGRQVASGQARFFEIKKHPLAGDIAGVKKISDRERTPGEWNKVEILARGSRYTVWMNGTLVNQVDGVEVLGGPVGLQSEGGVIQFRRVTLVPFD